MSGGRCRGRDSPGNTGQSEMKSSTNFYCTFVHFKRNQNTKHKHTAQAHSIADNLSDNLRQSNCFHFRSCIESYRVKLCQENDEDKICYEKQIIPDSEIVNDVVANLKMCSVYTIDIFPLYRKSEIRTKSTKFRTQSPVQNPLNVQISVDTAKDKVNFSWDKVKCASGYKVLQKLENSDSADWTFLTTKLQLDLDSPEPCSTIRYVQFYFHLFLRQELKEWYSVSVCQCFFKLSIFIFLAQGSDLPSGHSEAKIS